MNRLEAERFATVGAPAQRLTKANVVIVDERRLIADALASLLAASRRFTVKTCVTRDMDAAKVLAGKPDLVLVGVGESHERPLQLVATLHHLAPQVRTVILSESQQPDLIRSVLDQDVAALVLTEATADDLEVTLDHVLRGQAALPVGWQSVLAGSDDSPIASLSSRQLEVLRMLADGYTYEEISAQLIITVNTVKFHVRSIYLRLGVRNRTAAVKLLHAWGGKPAPRRPPRPS